jgi:flagellar biosynthesis protein FlhG
MIEAIRKQQVMVELYPDSKTSAAFEGLARSMLQEPKTIEAKGSIQFFWKRLLDFGNKG